MLNNEKTLKKVRELMALGFTIVPERKAMKEHVLRKFSTCAHCDRPSEHVATICPEKDGGTWEIENVKPVCSKHMIEAQLKEWFE